MPLEAIKLLILDVDGVLTDGTLTLTATGEPVKNFHVQDGFAIKLWQRAGGKVALLSGRDSNIVSARVAGLGIDIILQGANDKAVAYETIKQQAHFDDPAIAYVGDDIPDLPPMRRCAFAVAVRNAVPTVKQAAHYITRRPGGQGAVAEIVEFILRKQSRWKGILD